MKKIIVVLAVLSIAILPLASKLKAQDAVDYNLAVKTYVIDELKDKETNEVTYELMDEIIEKLNNNEIMSISPNAALEPGTIIAVATYLNSYATDGSYIDIELSWDDTVLEGYYIEESNIDNNSYIDYISYQGPLLNNWSGYTFHLNYYKDPKATVRSEFVKSTPKKPSSRLNQDGIISYHIFKVRERAEKDKLFSFDFSRTSIYDSNMNEMKVSKTPVTYKVGTKPNAERLKGDLNNDGKVDYMDYSLMVKFLTHTVILDEETKQLADFNGDGIVNVGDLSKFSRYIQFIEESLD